MRAIKRDLYFKHLRRYYNCTYSRRYLSDRLQIILAVDVVLSLSSINPNTLYMELNFVKEFKNFGQFTDQIKKQYIYK